MPVYIDNVRHQFGRMVMCHMWADTLDELLAMADKIGVQRKWLQQAPKTSWVHFDISLVKKDEAIKAGALLMDKYAPVEFTSKLDVASDDPRRQERGKRMLEKVAECRAMFGYHPSGRAGADAPQPSTK